MQTGSNPIQSLHLEDKGTKAQERWWTSPLFYKRWILELGPFMLFLQMDSKIDVRFLNGAPLKHDEVS